MSTSLVYRSAVGYELVMRVLYGRHYGDRMRAVAEQVPDGASVLELCCGPGTLYTRCLRSRTSGYIGLDVNEGFVAGLRRRGIDARRLDLSVAGVPLPGSRARSRVVVSSRPVRCSAAIRCAAASTEFNWSRNPASST